MARTVIRAVSGIAAAWVAAAGLLPNILDHSWERVMLALFATMAFAALAIIGPPTPAARIDRAIMGQLHEMITTLPGGHLLVSPDMSQGYEVTRVPMLGRKTYAVSRVDLTDWRAALAELDDGDMVTTMAVAMFTVHGRQVRCYAFNTPVQRTRDAATGLPVERIGRVDPITELRNMRHADRTGLSLVTEEEVRELVGQLRVSRPHPPLSQA